ncbi:MAG: peptidylprolyl isomerase [Pseudomonadota bacterium]|nr:MAG: peptidylprolyl isomerase [Pseudomonadota bacterium]
MRRHLSVSIATSLIFSAAAWAGDTPGAVTVNGQTITRTHIEFVAMSKAKEGLANTPELREQVREYLINRVLLEQEAKKQGIDKLPELKTEIELATQALLVAKFIERYKIEHPISEEELRKEYDRQRAELGDKEYLPSHILVDDREEALKIIAQLNQGADFREIAQQKTKDDATRKHGGGLQWSSKAGFIEPFAEAIVKLKKGEHTQQPVKTEHGWHVIKLDDERPLVPPSFEQVRVKLTEVMHRDRIDKYIETLRSKAEIKSGE